MEKWITPEEAAGLTGYDENYVRHLAREGKVTSRKFGHAVMIDRGSIVAYREKMSELKEAQNV